MITDTSLVLYQEALMYVCLNIVIVATSLVLLHHVICHDVNVSFMESCMEMIIDTGPAGQSCKLPV